MRAHTNDKREKKETQVAAEAIVIGRSGVPSGTRGVSKDGKRGIEAAFLLYLNIQLYPVNNTSYQFVDLLPKFLILRDPFTGRNSDLNQRHL